MKIWHIGDTHGYHDLLEVPKDIDAVIFSGDCGNVRDPYRNEHEVRSFLLWFSSLYIPIKIMIAGNHDSAFERKLITSTQCLEDYGIFYLEDEAVELDGKKFYGSPWTPTFNDWAFNRSRSKIDNVWQNVPTDEHIHVLITHGPPKGILDISQDRSRNLEMCGDNALYKRVINDIKPSWHCFGHIHNWGDHINAGTLKLSAHDTHFSNGSVVTDNKFGKLTSNGNIFEI